MRSAIGGILDYSSISQVHRPREEAAMSRAVRDLAAQGLKERDIGQALGLDPTAVRRLLTLAAAERRVREMSENGKAGA